MADPAKLYLSPTSNGLRLKTENRYLTQDVDIYPNDPNNPLQYSKPEVTLNASAPTIGIKVAHAQNQGWPKGSDTQEFTASVNLGSKNNKNQYPIDLTVSKSGDSTVQKTVVARLLAEAAINSQSVVKNGDPYEYTYNDGAGTTAVRVPVKLSAGVSSGYVPTSGIVKDSHDFLEFDSYRGETEAVDGSNGYRISCSTNDQLLPTANTYCMNNIIIEAINAHKPKYELSI